MICPRSETLSRWADGSLGPRERQGIRTHVEGCARCRAKVDELRAAMGWLASVSEEGEECLSIEGMAAVLEGRIESDHVETCPRCAAEFSALKAAARPATARRYRRRMPRAAWGVAASVAAAAGLLLLLIPEAPPPPPEIEVAKVVPAPVTPPRGPSIPGRDTVRPSAPVLPELSRLPDPEPAPPRPEPKPVLPAPSPPAPPAVARTKPAPRPTVTRPAAPKTLAVEVRTGSLYERSDGRWTKAKTVTEGRVLRASGRTRIEFAQASLTLEGSSKFTLTDAELALEEGRLSAEVHAGSPFALALGGRRIVPQAQIGRVLLSARPDRVVVDEGTAVSNEIVLHEGEEHHIRQGRMEPHRRTLPAAFRPRERLTWKLDLDRMRREDRRVTFGTVERHPEGAVLESGEPSNPGYCATQIGYLAPDPQKGFVEVKKGTAIRFRYFLFNPGPMRLVMWNLTKGENFEQEFRPVVRRWTTVTLYFEDIPPNSGGKKVICEVGDRYRSITLNAGKSGEPNQLLVNQLEILEIDR